MNRLRYRLRRSRVSVVTAGVVLVFVLGVADYLTGPELSFSIFYLIPITAVSWLVGLTAGVFTSVLAAVSFLAAILLEENEFEHASIPYWNALVRLGFFLIVTVSLSSVRKARDRREELQQFIVHDLRSPLANVMTGLAILREDRDEKLDAEHREFVDMCLDSCTRMLTLINSLLDLSRLERGGMPLRIESAQAADLCTAAINQVRLWAAQKNVRLSERIVEEAVVNADPEVTVRVLVNLLSNAITHAPEGSVVTVRLEERDESRFAVSVQDEGPGIPNEWAERVFDTYAQVDRDSSMPRGGTGLGLAFSKRAIQAQGGRIWMESGVEGGTIVTFTLPRAQEGETLSRPASRKRQ